MPGMRGDAPGKMLTRPFRKFTPVAIDLNAEDDGDGAKA